MAGNSDILALFAHPDDEVLIAGGALALLAGRGAAVHHLCATPGEGGEVGEPPLTTHGQRVGGGDDRRELAPGASAGGRSARRSVGRAAG
jgi:LmbE family N-acetylglucosaminyl deacetylase